MVIYYTCEEGFLVKFVIKPIIALLVIIASSPLVTYAETETEPETINYQEVAESMIASYEEMQKESEQGTTDDSRFTNDMVENQEKLQSELDEKIEEAKEENEKFYSLTEILNSSAQDFGISEEDMQRVKQSVKTQFEDDTKLLNAFKSLGKIDHPAANAVKEDLNTKIPKSLIYIDHSKDEEDGMISGGGWPYCLDDNGYGYKNFITSDCYKAIVGFKICAADSTLGKMNSKLRYCKANIRNCSPMIGHSKKWHTHKWYGKLP
jgi:hypothetical protein